MKFKKAYIFICLVVFLLTIAGVSAGNADEAVVQESDGQIEFEDESLSASAETFADSDCEIADADGEPILTGNSEEGSSAFISLIVPGTTRYGEDAVVCADLKKDAAGNVVFSLNGVNETVNITNGTATCAFPGLKVGTYNLSVYYEGNYIYAPDSIATTLTVNKNLPILYIDSDVAIYHENSTVTVYLAKNVPGNVKITVGNSVQRVKIENGRAIATFEGLKPKTHRVTVAYAGNVNYEAQTKTADLTVAKGAPFISLEAPDVTFGENATITAALFSDVPGNVWLTVNRVTERVKITNGTASYSISGFKSGTYLVSVYYAGNVYYGSQTFDTTLNIIKAEPIESISVEDIHVGDKCTITVRTAENVNGNVWITVNGVKQKVKIVDGIAALNVSGLKAGTYDVSAAYAGNTNFNAQTVTSSFTVSKLSPGITIRKSTVDGSPMITVKIAEDAPGNVRIIVNGTTYKVALTNGVASISLPNLGSGSHAVEAIYKGNYKYLAESKTQTISVR